MSKNAHGEHEQDSDAQTVIATYRMLAENEQRFLPMLQAHWPTLKRLGLVEDEPVQLFRKRDSAGVTYLEIFTWKPGAAERAHTHPEVAAIWEPMSTVLSPLGGLPAMDFPHYARVNTQ
jgi:hypothetical protein